MTPADEKRSISRSHLLGDERAQDPGRDSKMEMVGLGESNAAAGVKDVALTISPSEPHSEGQRGLNDAAKSGDQRPMDRGVAPTVGMAGLDAECTTASKSDGVLDSIPPQNRVDVRFSGVSTWVSATFMPPSTLALLRQKLVPGGRDVGGGEQSPDSKRQVGLSNGSCRSALLQWPRYCCSSVTQRGVTSFQSCSDPADITRCDGLQTCTN